MLLIDCVKQIKKRKQSFEKEETQLEPCRKTPKIRVFSDQIKYCDVPQNLTKLKNRDLLWMISHMFQHNIPMWIGWNLQVTVDNLPQQTIGYMDNYSLPPTRLDVVTQTMRTSQKVAAECGETYAIVHYDLAVAKLALSIQAEESSVYENVCVCFGVFHVQMAYFPAIGTLLADFGGPQVLTDVGVLASGSLDGFFIWQAL